MASESGSRPSTEKSRTQEETNSEISTAQESIEAKIRNNPIASVAIAAAAGFLYAIIRR